MARRKEIPITPSVLKWAREGAGYSLGEMVQKYPQFADWEVGASFPTYAELERIAERFSRPLAIFFFPDPPEEEPIEKSLRAMSEEDVAELSPHIRKLFRKAKSFQLSLGELSANESGKTDWLRNLPENSVPEQLAQDVRAALGVSLDKQKSWKDSDTALKQWRRILADKGVYIFKAAFKNRRIAGFCIYDNAYPIIYLNNSLPKNRQIFTIFHELAHLAFKESYLDVFDKEFWALETKQPWHLEVSCNAFAAEFLVPQEDFAQVVSGQPINDIVLGEWAKLYCVSRDVILRRLLTLGYIDNERYEKKVQEWAEFFADKEEVEKKAKKSDGRGDYYNTEMAYLGESYLGVVFQNYLQGRIDVEEAAEHLDVSVKNIPQIEDRFLARGIL